MTYSDVHPLSHRRARRLMAAFGVGCDNSVDQNIPDAEATPEGWTLVWADEFDGSALDASKWEMQLGDGCPDLCGWGNNEQQIYQEENLAVGDGLLTITARQDLIEADTTVVDGDTTFVEADTVYTSSRIRTKGMGDWTYGRFEIRAKLPQPQQGLWPAIWMLSTDDSLRRLAEEWRDRHHGGHWARAGRGVRHPALRRSTSRTTSSTSESFEFVVGTYADNFFVYTVEWEEGEIRWYINNMLYATQNEWSTAGPPGEESAPFPAPFDQDFHLLINLAVGGNLPGQPDETTTLPQQMEVDYVRVYERAEQP